MNPADIVYYGIGLVGLMLFTLAVGYFEYVNEKKEREQKRRSLEKQSREKRFKILPPSRRPR